MRATYRRKVPANLSASLRRMQPSIASSPSATAAETMIAMHKGAFSGSKPLRMKAAEKLESVPIRSLGCCERFFYLYSLAFPVHFCLVAQIEGALESADLGAALEQARKRHPALRACIDNSEIGPAFYRSDNPIALHTELVEAAGDWRSVVERELTLPFDTVPGPLMRATVLRASHGASLVLTFHHAIADALSGTRIIDDLMRALGGEHLEAVPPLPPVEEMIEIFTSNPA